MFYNFIWWSSKLIQHQIMNYVLKYELEITLYFGLWLKYIDHSDSYKLQISNFCVDTKHLKDMFFDINYIKQQKIAKNVNVQNNVRVKDVKWVWVYYTKTQLCLVIDYQGILPVFIEPWLYSLHTAHCVQLITGRWFFIDLVLISGKHIYNYYPSGHLTVNSKCAVNGVTGIIIRLWQTTISRYK